MKLPDNILRRAKTTGTPPAPKVKLPRGMNGLERAYAAHLDLQKQAGVIEWFGFQPWRLRIAQAGRQRFFTPDFVVMYRGGFVEFHETKGFMREAAALRLEVAATAYPFTFVVVKREDGAWTYRTIGGGNG